jgi:hypothetical protein
MVAINFPTCLGGCGTPADFPPLNTFSIRAEFKTGTVSAAVELCNQCADDAFRFPHRAAEIMTAILATPPKSLEEIAREKAERHTQNALHALYRADSVEEGRSALAYELTLIFGDDHQDACEVVAQHLTTKILRGLEVECVGSAPGDAIGRAMGEFE